MRPNIAMIKTSNNKLRNKFFDLAQNKYFEIFILVAIAANTLVMTIKWPNMSEKAKNTIEIINYFFLVIFFIEALIKLTGYGLRYFKDKWNVFDFVIVVISIIFIVIQNFWGVGLSTTTSVVRSLRIGRMFKLFRNLK